MNTEERWKELAELCGVALEVVLNGAKVEGDKSRVREYENRLFLLDLLKRSFWKFSGSAEEQCIEAGIIDGKLDEVRCVFELGKENCLGQDIPLTAGNIAREGIRRVNRGKLTSCIIQKSWHGEDKSHLKKWENRCLRGGRKLIEQAIEAQ